MKNAVFFVHTEYHLMMAYTIQKEIANEYDKITIYAISREDRLNENFNFRNSNCEVISINLFSSLLIKEIKKTLKLKPERLFIFNEDEPLIVYLIVHLKTTKIALVQDGLKPYSINKKKHELLSTIIDTLKGHFYLLKKGLFLNSIYLFELYKYGSSKQIHELWITNPDSFKNIRNIKLVQISLNNDQQTIEEIKELFQFNSKAKLSINSNVILYVHQAIWYDDFKIAEINLLRQIKEKFGLNSTIYVKKHPLVDKQIMQKFKSELNAIIIDDNIPAELYIMQLKNSIIISAWSTALLSNNTDCKFYYTMNIMPWDNIVKQLNPFNPTSHVKSITSINDISF